jgi:predicted metal-dependent phosphoesterase TrpH
MSNRNTFITNVIFTKGDFSKLTEVFKKYFGKDLISHIPEEVNGGFYAGFFKTHYDGGAEVDFENEIKLHRAAVNLETSELMNFYNHWRELTPSGKMRFQLETTWQTDLRLKKWESNLNKWSKNTPQTKQEDQKAKMNNAFNELANKYLNEL